MNPRSDNGKFRREQLSEARLVADPFPGGSITLALPRRGEARSS